MWLLNAKCIRQKTTQPFVKIDNWMNAVEKMKKLELKNRLFIKLVLELHLILL